MTYQEKEICKFHSKDPARRARQLSNIGKGNLTKKIKALPDAALIEDLQKADIITFIESPEFLGQSLFPAQKVLLKSLYGLKLSHEEIEIYKEITGLKAEHEPGQVKSEAVWCLGARSGKSFLASCIALYEGTRDKWHDYLRPGEAGYIIIAATRQDQARMIIQRNAGALIMDSPLQCLLKSEPTNLEIEFKSGMRILSIPCNSVAGRGIPICCLILDELAFFFGEGFVRADFDIFNSLRPRQAQFFPHSKTVFISTPAAKQGLFWNYFEQGFNVPGRLTVQAPTWKINPNIEADFYNLEKRRDPDNFDREYGGLFAERTSSFFDSAYIDKAFILPGDVPPVPGLVYTAAVDFSGLAGRDKTGFCIAHRTGEKVIVDVARSWASTDQDFIMNEIRDFTSAYNVGLCFLDRYGAGWTQGALEKIGLQSEIRESLPVIYSNLKTLMISGFVEMPENPDLKFALETLKAFYGRNNSLSVQHERTAAGHGDLADAVATAVFYTSQENVYFRIEPEFLFEPSIYGVIWKRNPEFNKSKLINFTVEKF